MNTILASCTLLLVMAFNAQAATVNFEDNLQSRYIGSFSSGELTFIPTNWVRILSLENDANHQLVPGPSSNPPGAQAFLFKENDNSVFSLDSLDARTVSGAFFTNGSVTFIGHQAGGDSLTKTLSLNALNSSYLFSWFNLLSVDVSAYSNSRYVIYDNFKVNESLPPINAIPIPSAAYLFGPALTGLIRLGNRKQTKMLSDRFK